MAVVVEEQQIRLRVPVVERRDVQIRPAVAVDIAPTRSVPHDAFRGRQDTRCFGHIAEREELAAFYHSKMRPVEPTPVPRMSIRSIRTKSIASYRSAFYHGVFSLADVCLNGWRVNSAATKTKLVALTIGDMKMKVNRLLAVCLLSILMAMISDSPADEPVAYFEIQVIDQETKRGVPLVELVTVNDVRYVTDNAGRVAYLEPGHAGQTIFFRIEAPGYKVPKDGFGIAGVRLKIEPGQTRAIALERINLAERLYRATGQGLYRDSVLLGKKTPLKEPLGAGKVAGQDSVQAAIYREKIYWFWGDTNRLSYPLGLFRMAGAVSPLPAKSELSPAAGINYDYFTGKDGFARAMAEVENPQGRRVDRRRLHRER